MKRIAVFMFVAVFTMAVMAMPALAAPGGAPALHGVDGKTFGQATSGLAQAYPGAVAEHILMFK
jgi:hypothetical protein